MSVTKCRAFWDLLPLEKINYSREMLILSFTPVACIAISRGVEVMIIYYFIIKCKVILTPPPFFFFYMKWNQYFLTCDWLKQIQSRNFSKSTAWRRLIIWTMWVSITARAPFVKYTSKQIFEESIPLIIHFIQEIIWKANETQIITVTWFIWAK